MLMILGALLLLCLLVSVAMVDAAIEMFAGLLVLATPFAILAILALLCFHAFAGSWRDRRRAPTDDRDDAYEDDVAPLPRATSRLTPKEQLQRRYIAGELSHTEFQREMLDVVKERFAKGQLSLASYERELDQLLERSRAVAEIEAPVKREPPTRRTASRPLPQD